MRERGAVGSLGSWVEQEDVLSLIVKRALLPGHGLDGAVHRRRFECRCSVWMKRVADGVDGGEGSLRGQ